MLGQCGRPVDGLGSGVCPDRRWRRTRRGHVAWIVTAEGIALRENPRKVLARR
jgi:hypothetical protein